MYRNVLKGHLRQPERYMWELRHMKGFDSGEFTQNGTKP
jgi:hypothetical protein